MCPWVGPHAPSFGQQLWGLLSPVEYLSPQGVLLPLVYGTTASPLWLELRGRSAWKTTPFWTVYRLACNRLLPWLQVTFVMVADEAWPGSHQWPWSTAPATGPVGRLGRPSVSDPWGVGSFLSLPSPTCVRCPGPLGSCSWLYPLVELRCVCGVLGHFTPVHRCARSVCCAEGAVTKRQRPGCLPTGTGKRSGLCVLCARCVEVCCGEAGPVHSRTWPTLPCRRLRAVTQGLICPLHPACRAAPPVPSVWCRTAWCSAPHCTVCALLQCCCGQGAVGSATHCQAAWGLWAMEIVLRTAALPEGRGEWYSRR